MYIGNVLHSSIIYGWGEKMKPEKGENEEKIPDDILIFWVNII